MAAEAAEGWMLPLLFAALGLVLGSFFSSVFSSLFTHPRPTWPFSALQVVCADCRKSASFSGSKASGACVSLGSDRKTEKQKKSFSDSCQSQLDVSLHSFKNTAKEDQSNFCLEVTGDISNSIPRAANNRDSPNLKPDPYDTTKRQGYLSWDDYFMAIAFLSAHRSKDPNRQVGACLVSQDRVILGIGYNGFPRGCSDDELPWAKMAVNGDPLQTKYPYVCHAEVNAILNKNHASACGQRLYVTMFPCNECAKIIIQAGVAEVVYFTGKSSSSDCSYIASQKLLSLAGVKVWQHQPEKQRLILEFK